MVNSLIENPYKVLDVKPTINAAGILTRIGGSKPPKEVFKAMEVASRSFVTIAELQKKAGNYLAIAAGAEAGLPTAGGSASILLSAAACIMKGTELENYEPIGPAVWRKLAQRLPLHTKGLKTDFIVQKCNRDEYDHAVECAGGRFIEVGDKNGASIQELRDAFVKEKTAAFYYTLKSSSGLPLDEYVKIAHAYGVPVILDASVIVPPKNGKLDFVEMGVDLVCISGGKTLSGPNNTGILVGRKDLIKLAHLQSYPFEGVGRSAKMCRETIVGLIAAYEVFKKRDEVEFENSNIRKAEYIKNELKKIYGISAYVNQPNPLCIVKADKIKYGLSTKELYQSLLEGDPSIMTVFEPYFLIEDFHDVLSINPHFLTEEEIKIIIKRVKENKSAQ
jgi:uncharacterized pyridoxal phosphate-dependent enzyme